MRMESAKHHLLAYLPLALALLLCLSVCIESQTYGNNKVQRANDGEGTWCIAKPSSETENLSRNIEYSCSQNGVDCRPIQPGGRCFRPNTIVSHASYAMNLFYKAAGKHPWDCHFNATGMTVTQDPSFGTCKYPV